MNGRTDRVDVTELADVGKRIWSHWQAGNRDVVRALLMSRESFARCAVAVASADYIRSREGSGEALRFAAWLGQGCPSFDERRARVVSGTGDSGERKELRQLVEGLRSTGHL